MPEIVFTDRYGGIKSALQEAFHQEPSAAWNLATITHTYHQHIYKVSYAEEELGRRLVAFLESYETVKPALLWQYSNFSEESQGLVFMDYNHEAEWAWQQTHRQENPPYLIRTYQEVITEQMSAWQRCYLAYQSEETEIRICRNELDFRVLCGTAQEFDPCLSYVVSGMTQLNGILRTLKHSYQANNTDLHELIALGQQCGWAYGWKWGGGEGEYVGTFWARDAVLSRQLAMASGIRVLGHF